MKNYFCIFFFEILILLHHYLCSSLFFVFFKPHLSQNKLKLTKQISFQSDILNSYLVSFRPSQKVYVMTNINNKSSRQISSQILKANSSRVVICITFNKCSLWISACNLSFCINKQKANFFNFELCQSRANFCLT